MQLREQLKGQAVQHAAEHTRLEEEQRKQIEKLEARQREQLNEQAAQYSRSENDLRKHIAKLEQELGALEHQHRQSLAVELEKERSRLIAEKERDIAAALEIV